MIKEIYLVIKGFFDRLAKDNIGLYSAQAAFFMFMSIIPFLTILLTLVKFLPITQSYLHATILNILPEPFEPFINQILTDLFSKSTDSVLPISIIMSLWAAGKGIMAIINGLNSVYHIEDNRNYFFLRFIAAIYTLIFVIGITITLVLLVFSNQIYHTMRSKYPKGADFIAVFIQHKYILSILFLTIFFILVYKLTKFKTVGNILTILPGSLFSAGSWTFLSYGLSVYINHFTNFSYTYGSLTTIVLFMIWLYASMFLMFIGAEINSYFRIYFSNMKHMIFKTK